MYNTVLFDLDGTLTDSAQGIMNSIVWSLDKMGESRIGEETMRKFLGPPLEQSFRQHCGFSAENAKRAVEYYREYFRKKGMLENTVYDGIEDALAELKSLGKKLIVATSKPEPFTNRILNHFGLQKYFDFIAGSELDGTRCNKDEIIQYALKSCGITDLSSVVMVGDREHDIIGAKKSGIDSIGVLYGYGNLNELKNAGADYIAENVSDIVNIIKRLNS